MTASSSTTDADGLRAAAADFTWMVSRFAGETAGVVDAIAVSSDGLLIAVSRPGDQADSERLAAIVSGITSLAAGAAGNYGLGQLNQVIIDMAGGYLLVSSIGSGSVLGVVASKDAKLGNVAYEMTLFANRVGAILSPQLIVELKNTVGASG
ncbi:MAG TPA: roadblock/LC7 domain-containing protein [Actinocrinis sp.]